jgi:hypothetical protein
LLDRVVQRERRLHREPLQHLPQLEELHDVAGRPFRVPRLG